MAIHSGDLVFVDYGEVPQVVHTRLVLAEVDSSINDWVILTPDFDIYTETLAANNPDFVGFHLGLPGGLVPPAIPPGVVYGFAPMTAADLARFMNDGRLEALAERGRRVSPMSLWEPRLTCGFWPASLKARSLERL